MNKPYTVTYQKIWFDFNLADGTYSPKQLRAAGLVCRGQGGRVLRYQLTWPGGEPQPPAYALRVTGRPGQWSISREASGGEA